MSSSGPLSGPAGFLLVDASAFHLILCPNILEKLSFPAEVPVFLFISRHKLLNFNLSEPPNWFSEIMSPMFFEISLMINFLPFGIVQRSFKLIELEMNNNTDTFEIERKISYNLRSITIRLEHCFL